MGRVLIAEDDEGVRVMTGSVLRGAGHQIEFAANGLEAMERIEANPYDCVLLDLTMPGASGYEVLAWLHRERKGFAASRVIVLTAMSGASLTHLTSDRVFAVVRKPFDVDELRDLVARCSNGGQSIHHKEAEEDEENGLKT
jgi:CheY-like chemotaxis protein